MAKRMVLGMKGINTIVGSIAKAAPTYSRNSTHPAVTTLR